MSAPAAGRAELLAFLRSRRFAVQASVSGLRAPQAAVVASR